VSAPVQPAKPSLDALAAENLRRLEANPYPGRGIVLGRSVDGTLLLQVYWIMGRSENSRNRRFVAEGGRLRTEAVDAARLANPELVIYTAMDALDGQHVVSNGDHTDTIIQALRAGQDYRAALRTRAHEPDPPHHTPRIAGGIRAAEGDAWLAIVKPDPGDPGRCLRQYFEIEALPPGWGWCITTYAGDGNPLPGFQGEPQLLPLAGGPQELLEALWGLLNRENRVAMAVKAIDAATGRETLRILNARAPQG
jgi:IMP cyclohydrolase